MPTELEVGIPLEDPGREDDIMLTNFEFGRIEVIMLTELEVGISMEDPEREDDAMSTELKVGKPLEDTEEEA